MSGSTQIPISIAMVASATVSFTSSVYTSSNLKDALNAVPLCDCAAFYLDVTNNVGFFGNTLAPGPNLVSIETSYDNGANWYPAFNFVQVTTSANQQRIDVRIDGIGFTEAGTNTSVAVGTATSQISVNSSAVNGNMTLTRDIRVKIRAGTGTSSFSCAVWGIFMPVGRHAF